MNLIFDYETKNLLNLKEVGLSNYCASTSLAILMCSYCFDDGPVKLWEKRPPEEFLSALKNPKINKVAWNCPFERGVTANALGISVPYDEWIDAQVYARYLSLPGSLEDVGEILGLPADQQKMKDGKRLIKMFCEPCHLGGEVGLFGVSEPRFHDQDDKPEDWKLFREYCIRDTETERTLFQMMASMGLPAHEQKLWELDQKINDRGLPTNPSFVENLYTMAARSKEELLAALKQKTQLENPNSNEQILKWVRERGYPYNSVRKEFVAMSLAGKEITLEAREVLQIRTEASKNSFKKLEALKLIVSPDSYLKNQFVFMGAPRSARWSSYGFQAHNMPRPTKEVEKNLERALEIVEKGDYEAAKKEFTSVIGMATSCVRQAFQAPDGYELGVCDLNAIENRGIGWISGCGAILDVFRLGRDPYIDFGAKMYKLSYDDLYDAYKRGEPEAKEKRQIAKPGVLGAGYSLGGGDYKLNSFGDTVKGGLWGYAENMGIKMSQEDAHLAVKIFRESFPEVVQSWKLLENAAINVLSRDDEIQVGPIIFDKKVRKNGQKILRIKLPSGRYIHYFNARLQVRILKRKEGKEYGKECLTYDGIGHGVGTVSEAEGGKGLNWGPVFTFGGKILENLCQAISRDVLANAMMLADDMGLDIRGHFHDEILVLLKKNDPFEPTFDDLKRCMETSPDWGKDFPLAADGYTGKLYRKG